MTNDKINALIYSFFKMAPRLKPCSLYLIGIKYYAEILKQLSSSEDKFDVFHLKSKTDLLHKMLPRSVIIDIGKV